jgi:tetratricopeptide (TPR) repeat protein
MKIIAILSLQIFLIQSYVKSQNCEAFKMYGDTLQYQACIIADEAENHYQFSKEYQEIYDNSIKKCSYFSTAYHAKSVAYLKSGDFIEWMRLMTIAVELKPKEYLGYRGWCRYEFCRDYLGAIKDIERLDSLVTYDIGYSSDGEYHLDIARALCYKKIGNPTKAISIIETKLGEENYSPGLYDYFHLAVLYIETGQPIKSITAIEEQIEINENAECYYYLALAHKDIGNGQEYESNIIKAQEKYVKGNKMSGSYTNHMDKIYLKTVEEEIKNGL